jgi:hypothetical protein
MQIRCFVSAALLLASALTLSPALAEDAVSADAGPGAGTLAPIATQPAKRESGSKAKLDARAHRLAKDIAADIKRVEPYLERYGYWAVFAAVGVEGMGIPAPGQTLLEAGALVAAVPDSKLNIFPLLFALMVPIKRRGRS